MTRLPVRFSTLFLFQFISLQLFFSLCNPADAQVDKETVSWSEALSQDAAWYSSTEARRIADNLLIYQHPNGGWTKNIDMAKTLSNVEIARIQNIQKNLSKTDNSTTIDNGATYSQLWYLALVIDKTQDKVLKDAFLKGIDYLLEAQYDNGGWPQYYPIRRGYYENITFNDGAMMGVMELLKDISSGNPPYKFVDAPRQKLARNAVEKGLEVILKTQIKVDGKLTAWCAQYDPVDLSPTGARAYELSSLSGSESVGIVKYMMELEDPDEKVKQAITSAMEWFEMSKLTGIRIIKKEDASLPRGYNLVVGFDPLGATPLWARFYEIGTNFPIFVDRDGVVQYALSEISHERRVGYRWLGDWAGDLSGDYARWFERWGSH